MKVRRVCAINSFNYKRFLEDCLLSVENQSIKFDLVIIVDDGSTDGSQALIQEYCKKNSGWRLIEKENGGQLSCFNAIIEYIDVDDIVCFLDADDAYPSDYLNELSRRYLDDVDFIFCETKKFRENELKTISTSFNEGQVDVHLPLTSGLVRSTKSWIGSPTSAISMRGWLLKKILPYPYEREWRVRADDVLVYGASLYGVRKLYCPSLSVAYRVHASNAFHGRARSVDDDMKHKFHVDRMFYFMCSKFDIELHPDAQVVIDEYSAFPRALLSKFGLPKYAGKFVFKNLRDNWRIFRRAMKIRLSLRLTD